jgi:hypothetical protein
MEKKILMGFFYGCQQQINFLEFADTCVHDMINMLSIFCRLQSGGVKLGAQKDSSGSRVRHYITF